MVMLHAGLHLGVPHRRTYEWPTPNKDGDPRADVTLEVLPTAWGYLGGTLGFDNDSNEPITIVRCGVKLQMVFSGLVGKPSVIELIRRAIEGVVLFGVAEFLTRNLARWLIYGKRFEDIATEEVDMESVKVLDRDGGLIGRLHNALMRVRPGKAASAQTGDLHSDRAQAGVIHRSRHDVGLERAVIT